MLNSFLTRFCSDLCCSSAGFDDLREEKKPSEAAEADTSLLLFSIVLGQNNFSSLIALLFLTHNVQYSTLKLSRDNLMTKTAPLGQKSLNPLLNLDKDVSYYLFYSISMGLF